MQFILAQLLLAAQPSSTSWEEIGRPLPAANHSRVALDQGLFEYKPCLSELGGVKTGSVTTILPDLFKRWWFEFSKAHPGVMIKSDPPYGPPQGRLSSKLTDFIEGKSDFALVSRGLTGADQEAFRRANGQDPIVIPVAMGSWRHFGFVDTLVVIVNEANPATSISFAQIDAIFSSSRLRGLPSLSDWGGFGNGMWAGRDIHPVGGATWLKDDSARSAVVRRRVLNGGHWQLELASGGDEASAVERVRADPQAIAITGLGHVGPGVRALHVSAGAKEGFFGPTIENVQLNKYPLNRTIDLLLRRQANGELDPILGEFARFVLSRTGQQVVAEQGVFLPLRAEQVGSSLGSLGQCRQP